MNRPEVCSKYFENCNAIDVHNQGRQFELRLEKHWVTQCGFFRLITTLFGMTICDAWHGYRHHLPLRHPHQKIVVLQFASILAEDCLENQFGTDQPSSMMLTIGVPSTESSGSCSSYTDEFTMPAKQARLVEGNLQLSPACPSSGAKTTSSVSVSNTAIICEAFKEHTTLAQSPIDVPFNLSKEERSGKQQA